MEDGRLCSTDIYPDFRIFCKQVLMRMFTSVECEINGGF